MVTIVVGWVLYSAVFAGIGLLLMGLLWAPFAALICGYIARKKNANATEYAWTGAKSSSLQLLPWIYLVSQMRDRPLSNRWVKAGYVLVYGLWIIGPLGLSCVAMVAVPVFLILIALGFADIGGDNPLTLGLLLAVSTTFFLLSARAWRRSHSALRAFHLSRQEQGGSIPIDTILPEYLSPFKHAIVWHLATPTVGFLLVWMLLTFYDWP